jgi:hypothetical protein
MRVFLARRIQLAREPAHHPPLTLPGLRAAVLHPVAGRRQHPSQIFLRFFLDARMESFLRGHIAAFDAWNRLPRVLLYDNLLKARCWNVMATPSASRIRHGSNRDPQITTKNSETP